MGWPASILVALLAGALGVFAAGLVMYACVGWYRISSFEGKSGYAIVAAAFLGGVAALILGLVTARMMPPGGMAGFLRGLGVSWAIVVSVALLSAGIARALADIPPTIDGCELMLEVEIRLPVGADAVPVGDERASYFHLHSVVRGVARKSLLGRLRPADARLVDGRRVVPGSVHVFTERGLRSVGIVIAGGPPFGFIVPLPARPKRAHEAWSEWGPRPPPPKPPWPDTRPSFRFRVQKIGVERAAR